MTAGTQPTTRIEVSIPDDPKLRTIAAITKAGDAVIVFKKATVEQLTEDSAPITMHLVQHLAKTEKDNQ